MEKEEFSKRLVELRMSKGVSARDMSLSLGLSHGFINRIENGAGLPTMENFFYICDYLGITPKDFFDVESPNALKLNEVMEAAKPLTNEQLDAVLTMIEAIKK